MLSIMMLFRVGWWWFLKKEFKHQGRRWTRRPPRHLPLVKFDEKMLWKVAHHCRAGLTLSIDIVTPVLMPPWELISPEGAVEAPPNSASGPGRPDTTCTQPCASHVPGSSGNQGGGGGGEVRGRGCVWGAAKPLAPVDLSHSPTCIITSPGDPWSHKKPQILWSNHPFSLSHEKWSRKGDRLS